MNQALMKVAIRYNAVYVADAQLVTAKTIRQPAANLVANLNKIGYTVSEELLHQFNFMTAPQLLSVYEAFVDVLQLKNNWDPLVKGWDIPTNETKKDHWLTELANKMKFSKGTTLTCGHLIPSGTFSLERYNGCPFCGMPFELNHEIYKGQGSKLKELALWEAEDAQTVFKNLLQSKTALDASQADSLKIFLNYFELPEVEIGMKETLILLVDGLAAGGKTKEAGALFKSPVDIMRYLWFKQTGFLQIIEPKTILKRVAQNNKHMATFLDNARGAKRDAKSMLKLKYSRGESRMVAQWLNDLSIDAETAAVLMHPKRAMWVRFIRALRLAEYSRQKGMESLAELLHIFYNEYYEVPAGVIEQYRLKADAEKTFALLQARPGLFARSLFANMLWFGADDTLTAFAAIAHKVPARLLFTLNSYAKNYFDRTKNRSVKPLGGTNKRIPANRLLELYTDAQLKAMIAGIETMCLDEMEQRYAKMSNNNKTIFIEKSLFYMPMAIGDRAESVQDLPVALMGTQFPLEGNAVRLFMQWGKGMRAQHLDMDLSCIIAYDNKIDNCSYYNLHTVGAYHSGDIRSIPNEVGTAEYIDLNLDVLNRAGAKYVSFTCNAYSNGAITPNLVVGWMNSAYPMKVNERTGVAYDPSCVQHQVRVTQTLAKGLLFGVLDVARRTIIWLEQTFNGQIGANLDLRNVEAMLSKLEAKTTVGNILALKARAQGLKIVGTPSAADEVYDSAWAMDTAAVTQLLID